MKIFGAFAHSWAAQLVVLALVAWWVWDQVKRPYGRCWWCLGTGRSPGSTARRYGLCKHCAGTGRRVRIGARITHKKPRR